MKGSAIITETTTKTVRVLLADNLKAGGTPPTAACIRNFHWYSKQCLSILPTPAAHSRNHPALSTHQPIASRRAEHHDLIRIFIARVASRQHSTPGRAVLANKAGGPRLIHHDVELPDFEDKEGLDSSTLPPLLCSCAGGGSTGMVVAPFLPW